jgi:hypothetical protein
MQTAPTRFQPGAIGTPASRISLSRDLWLRAVLMNHRFDKLGNPLPLELHGCGCGLCARQQRAIRQFWEAR